MNENEISVKHWQTNFKLGLYEDNELRVQCDAGWYDWFCSDGSLARKTKKLGRIIAKVQPGGKVNLDTSYVWFKNNCPLNGPLYDDFRFADIRTGNTLLTIQVDCPYNQHKYTVYGRKCASDTFNTETPLFECDKSSELVAWLNTPWEE